MAACLIFYVSGKNTSRQYDPTFNSTMIVYSQDSENPDDCEIVKGTPGFSETMAVFKKYEAKLKNCTSCDELSVLLREFNTAIDYCYQKYAGEFSDEEMESFYYIKGRLLDSFGDKLRQMGC